MKKEKGGRKMNMYNPNVNRDTGVVPYNDGNGQAGWADPIFAGQMMMAREWAKADISLQKQDRMLRRKLQHEKEMLELKVYFQQLHQLLACQVYSDESGKVIFALTDPKEKEIVAKPLLKVQGYKATILNTYYPKPESALHIRWSGQEEGKLIFLLGPDGIDVKKFLKAIKSQGLLMQVSVRIEKQASDALLAYSLNSAKCLELPGCHGWNQMKDGSWHYAHEREQTFEEVKRDAYTR